MRAHAPGSVTTLFAPVDGGAHGVSFTTVDGVVAAVTPADATRVTLDGEPTRFEPVELACESLDVAAHVELTANVPVGCGFGASGAATLATVLAANAEFDLGRGREGLVEVAARAEVEAGTGLADVYVQALGGLAWDVGDGRHRRDLSVPVEYESYGSIATGEVLADEAAMDRVRSAGREALDEFEPGGDLSSLFERSWTFARATGLASDEVRSAVERVVERGGAATMAMVGETVVATGTTGVLHERTRITPEGARILRD